MRRMHLKSNRRMSFRVLRRGSSGSRHHPLRRGPVTRCDACGRARVQGGRERRERAEERGKKGGREAGGGGEREGWRGGGGWRNQGPALTEGKGMPGQESLLAWQPLSQSFEVAQQRGGGP